MILNVKYNFNPEVIRMEKINYFKIMLSLTVALFICLGVNGTALGYGDGGGSDTSSSEPAPTKVTRLSEDEMREIFSSLDAESRETMTNVFSGSDLTARELMTIRQEILEASRQSAQTGASIIHGLTLTVEGLDWLGQKTQTALSFVPGVGWVTSGVLDAARGGADAYRDGKSASEILKEATIAGVSSVTINKLSPLGADETFNSARGAWNILTRGSGKHTGKAARVFIRSGIKYVAKKEGERRAGDALKEGLRSSTSQAPNRVPTPTYINSSLGYDVTPMGTRVYK
jgi:hypothetical protein